ncbi:AraC family transcriptional regulator [Paenibacillus psychroresistens]|uniref:AraC family transcriptional regulator n=1 Tax=Paenibacillus psychroresistens TaxID=1778678 RepID=A0A6B8RWA6_9BACL|nr:helix-turn-helix domain-containing protein [Paenibacillus psychroresistens]QGQ99398.1 AraC family transcriptional regulator [Paenibacillus psychroresistens]
MNKTFTKFFISYIAIVFVSVSLLSSVLYIQFSKSSLEDIQINLKETLDQTAVHMSYIRENISSLGFQMLHDSEIMNIIYSSNVLTIDKYLISLKISNILNSNPVIHSMYLYNNKSGNVQYNLSISNSSFQDPEILTLLTKSGANQNLQFLPRRVAYTNSNRVKVEENLISLIFTDTVGQLNNTNAEMPDRRLIDGALVINLKAEYVQKSINTAVKGKDSYTAIIDGFGNVICDSSLQNFGKNVAKEAYMDQIVASKKNWGYEVKTIEGQKTVVTYVRSPTLPWTFINVSSYDSLFQKFHQLMMTLLIICTIIFLIGVALSLLAARNVYLPFSKLIKNIDSQLFSRKLMDDDKKRPDDARYLSNAFTHILQHSDHLELSVKDNASLIKRDHLKRVLAGNIPLEHSLCSKLEEPAIGVILLSIDGYIKFTEAYDRQTQNYMKSSLDAIVLSQLPAYFNFEPVYLEKDNYCLIVGTGNEADYYRNAVKAVEEIQKSVKLHLGITISAGIGQLVHNLEDAYLSYNDSLELLLHRFVQGYNSILSKDTIKPNSKNELASMDKSKKRLTDALKLSNMEQVEIELDVIIEEMSGYRHNYIMLNFNQLVLDVLKSVETHIDSIAEELDFNSVYRELNNMDALADLRTWFMQFCLKINRLIENKRANRKTDMIQGVLDYIANHYVSSEIGIEMLADKAGLSPGYFGKLFSDSIGKTVTEYIIELRMQHSKQLLETTLMPINDIAASVGFSNPAYFTTIYKKHFGITPNQYRAEFRKNNPL